MTSVTNEGHVDDGKLILPVLTWIEWCNSLAQCTHYFQLISGYKLRTEARVVFAGSSLAPALF